MVHLGRDICRRGLGKLVHGRTCAAVACRGKASDARTCGGLAFLECGGRTAERTVGSTHLQRLRAMLTKILIVVVVAIVGVAASVRVWRVRRTRQQLDTKSAAGLVPGPDDAGTPL